MEYYYMYIIVYIYFKIFDFFLFLFSKEGIPRYIHAKFGSSTTNWLSYKSQPKS